MLKTMYTYLKQGLSRRLPDESIGGQPRRREFRADIQNILPYVKKYWRRGILGVGIILVVALLAASGSLIRSRTRKPASSSR